MTELFRKKPFNLLVAKNNGQEWLPYYAHAMDVAGVIQYLLSNWVPIHIYNTIAEKHSKVNLQNLCSFIALVHDIGKLTSLFQTRICETSTILKSRIEKTELFIPSISDYLEPSKTPHSFAGEAILLRAGCPQGIASIIGSHHGSPYNGVLDPEDLIDNYEENFFGRFGKHSRQGKKWNQIQNDWIDIALELSEFHDIADLPDIDVPDQLILSGLLIMADWIASNSYYAPFISVEDTGIDLFYPQRIRQICENLNLPDQWLPDSFYIDDDMFAEKFGFAPNEMQRQMIQKIEDSDSPGIYVLEAQMGVGKTEAALSSAEVLASRWNCEGVFFGLPTQSTANGIFPRLISWAESQSEGAQYSIKLAHGMAMLHEGYRELFRGRARQNEDQESSLVVHPWFEGRKQTLLSSFVVGTVDQLLMAALKQKHVMLRHLGLAGKVIIIDECHAYDAYMNRYLERALEWLGIYKVPVILLSATLPAQRRIRLVEAYLGKYSKHESEMEKWMKTDAYPLLTYTDNGEIKQCPIKCGAQNKTVIISKIEVDDITNILKSKLSNGGCAGIIVNTIHQAQILFDCIQAEFPHYETRLLHARYTMADRKRIEAELLERIGKKSKSSNRNLIVIGTQILEQSLDIDFDILFTQLAPMDLLLQRIGRLHRHSFRSRPKLLEQPLCYVFGCTELDEGSKYIYGEWLLKRTEILLPEIIKIPQDIPLLVQETYRNLTAENDLYQYWIQAMEQQHNKEKRAESYRIPSKKVLEDTLHGLLDSQIGDRESDALARVRDGETSISVMLMVYKGEGKVGFLPWLAYEDISTDHVPSEEEAREIVLQKIQLPGVLSRYCFNECIEQLEKQNILYLQEWQQSRLLQGELVLLLNSDLEAELCGYKLLYDIKYGLKCGKEE